MKKLGKIMLIATVMFAGTAVFAGPHGRHHKRDGLDLAAGIVDLVLKVVRPEPAVTIYQQPGYYRPAPKHHRPAPKHHRPAPKHHR